ncbi:MAG: hypothetical protein AAFU73_15950 [Planctomycetota bacterium]
MGVDREFERGPHAPVTGRRVVVVVEAFLRHVRDGGALDVDPWLVRFPELREELEPLLRMVLRLELARLALESGELGAGD